MRKNVKKKMTEIYSLSLLEEKNGLHHLRHLLDRYLSKERLEAGGIFDAAYVHETLKEYYAAKYININEIWFVLMFEMWREEWKI